MKTYDVGIVGYGWAATAHIDAINATRQGRVAAICSSRPLDAAELSARHGGPISVYRDLGEMLADESLRVVDITSYPSRHRDEAVAAARAGKHFILEKPMANTPAEVRDIVAAAREHGVRGCVCFELLFSSQAKATLALLREGLLGRVHYGEVDYYHGVGPWYGQFRWNTGKKDGGSALLSAGCHALNFLLALMGGEVESVTSLSTKSASPVFAPYEYDTTSSTILRFKGGAVGKSVACIDCLQPYYLHTHLVGSEGSLLDDRFHSSRLEADKSRWSTLSMKLCDSGDVSDHPYQAQFQAFFDALDAGEEMPFTSLPQAAKTFEAIFAADESAAHGGVPVKPTAIVPRG